MTNDAFTPIMGNRRGLNPIDNQSLLACIPDEDSMGLTEDEIKKEYGNRCGLLFHIEDFQKALLQLADDEVRSTHRTLPDRTQVPYYRRA